MLRSLKYPKAAPPGAALLFLGTLLLGGCAGPASFGGSREAVQHWGEERGFAARALTAGDFQLFSLARPQQTDVLTVYIEGDGAAWHSPWQPPRDPTPLRPVALAMAAADPAGNVAYLGRPCQYLDAAALARCAPDYWTLRRFAPEVVETYMVALDQLKSAHAARRLKLVGHSGGGVIAALLALRRDDVAALVTVAAPLAVNEWTRWHEVTPLDGSLDPAIAAGTLGSANAVHFAGEDDKVVPHAIVAHFASAKGGRVVRLPGHDHDCCWARDWPQLLEMLK